MSAEHRGCVVTIRNDAYVIHFMDDMTVSTSFQGALTIPLEVGAIRLMGAAVTAWILQGVIVGSEIVGDDTTVN